MPVQKGPQDIPVSLRSIETRWRRCLSLAPRDLWRVSRGEHRFLDHLLHASVIDLDLLFDGTC